MSHFSVAVFHRKDQDIDELLAPFDENKQVEPYISYTRQEAIDYARKNYKSCAGKSDDECWHAMADDASEGMVDSEGNILSTYNPQSKWDWYCEGGRWGGYLKAGGQRRDSAPVKDIDFSMDKEAYERALRFWDVAVDHKPAGPDEDYTTFYKEEYYREYYGNRETYARHQAQFSTYAVVTPDGQWHGKGRMGWFGFSSETADEAKDWEDHYRERFIDPALASEDELYLTIVDCHI